MELIVFLDMSRVQDDEVGDGTTSVTVLAAELLRVRVFDCYYLMLWWLLLPHALVGFFL